MKWSNRNLVGMDAKFPLASIDEFDHVPEAHLRVDKTHLEPHEVAARAVEYIGL